MTERAAFFLRFVLNPQQIGSITPSSDYLARRMLADLPWNKLETVIELGAGTGVFTRFIAAHKQDACRVLVVEQDNIMRQVLQNQYPDFNFGSHAEQLSLLLSRYQLGAADCIVSGLPFAVFSTQVRELLLTTVWNCLKPGGVFVAFQYSLQLRPLLKRRFRQVDTSFVLFNLPPAFVYVCRK